jgi:presenilin 1
MNGMESQTGDSDEAGHGSDRIGRNKGSTRPADIGISGHAGQAYQQGVGFEPAPLSPRGDRGVSPPPLQNANPRREIVTSDEEELDTDRLLMFGAEQILNLFVPVSICMFVVVCVASTIKYYTATQVYLPYTPFHSGDTSVGTMVWESLANAAIFICLVIAMTILLVLLFKYECYRIIHGWLMLTTVMVLFFISFIFFTEVIRSLRLFMDFFTLSFLMWNFGIAGIIVIHWRGPLLIQQAYLVFISAQIALLFLKYLPQWTCWVLLAVLAIWDLVAVLCAYGPLRLLVEMAQNRQKPLFPALIYSTTANLIFMVDPGETQQQPQQSVSNTPDESLMTSSQRARAAHEVLNHGTTSDSNRPLTGDADFDPNEPQPRRLRQIHDEVMSRQDRGVKLGLGDFVFYSLLMGRATLDGDWNTIAACYIAILIGMCVTILLLAIAGRALPALPISIVFGITFYFITAFLISPFTDLLTSRQVFL